MAARQRGDAGEDQLHVWNDGGLTGVRHLIKSARRRILEGRSFPQERKESRDPASIIHEQRRKI